MIEYTINTGIVTHNIPTEQLDANAILNHIAQTCPNQIDDFMESYIASLRDNTEDWVNAITKGLLNLDDITLSKIEKLTNGEESTPEAQYLYNEFAGCIIEPSFELFDDNSGSIEEEYHNFQEFQNDKWIAFIKQNFDENWGKLAEITSDYGY